MVFRDEEGKEDLIVKGKTLDTNTLELTLFNFKNSLGAGTTKPLSLGTLEGRRLHVQYRVYELKGCDKTIHYTIYCSEEVDKNE